MGLEAKIMIESLFDDTYFMKIVFDLGSKYQPSVLFARELALDAGNSPLFTVMFWGRELYETAIKLD